MNAELFRWARETAGLDPEAAAKALAIKPGTLDAIERGAQEPTRPQLLGMARVYRRPLITFYLPHPPAKGERGQDFRTLPPDRSVADDAALDALVRDVRARQALLRAVVDDEDDALALAFVGGSAIADGSDLVLSSITSVLGIDRDRYRRSQSAEAAFAYLRDRAEASGIYVLLMGNLGSHHSAIAVETFRGFAIADPLAPFIVINDQDARTAWSFTLLHELAHLWLGATGVSGERGDSAIERFCNEVAGKFLLPAGELAALSVDDSTPTPVAIERIGEFARRRFVSRRMVAYALRRAGRLGAAAWRVLDEALHAAWQHEQQARKARRRGADSGPNYYVVRRHRLGNALLRLVERSMAEGGMTPVKAARLLGVRPRSVYPLLYRETTARQSGAGA